MAHKANDPLLADVEPAANTGVQPRVKSSGRRDAASVRRLLQRQQGSRWNGVVLGTLAAYDLAGNPLVDYPGNATGGSLVARSTVPLRQAAPDQQVALMFVEGDPRQPLVIGLLEPPAERTDSASRRLLSAEVDGERLVFTAEREIVFRCGEASITLTQAGKVLIRGAYLLSRSSGVNRIKGGSVQIN